MLRGDAALPFKDIVRSYDQFTQSVLQSLVQFNRKFNPDQAAEGDYDVIARGATSLIAKEVRGQQIDQISQTMTPEEKLHVDMRKLVEQRFKVRDLLDLLVPKSEADRRQQAMDQSNQQQTQQQNELMEANIRKLLSDAFKNVAQGQKNSATANAEAINTALLLMEQGVMNALHGQGAGSTQPGQNPQGAQSQPGDPGNGGAPQGPGVPPGAGQGGDDDMLSGGAGAAPGQGQGAP
jgi:hypothetical protein